MVSLDILRYQSNDWQAMSDQNCRRGLVYHKNYPPPELLTPFDCVQSTQDAYDRAMQLTEEQRKSTWLWMKHPMFGIWHQTAENWIDSHEFQEKMMKATANMSMADIFRITNPEIVEQ